MSYKGIKKDKIKLFFKKYNRFVKLNLEEKKALLIFIKVRLMAVILWHEVQRKKHHDKHEQIDRGIINCIEEYKLLNGIDHKAFLKILE